MRARTLNTWPLVAVIAAAASTGCTPEVRNYVRFPDVFHPGWAQHQRAEAIEHDPYPLDDVGPEVVGGRPREYQRPVPEVDRARMNTTPPVALPSNPVMPWPTVPPPVVTGPPVVTTPYPAAPTQAPTFQMQQRSPY